MLEMKEPQCKQKNGKHQMILRDTCGVKIGKVGATPNVASQLRCGTQHEKFRFAKSEGSATSTTPSSDGEKEDSECAHVLVIKFKTSAKQSLKINYERATTAVFNAIAKHEKKGGGLYILPPVLVGRGINYTQYLKLPSLVGRYRVKIELQCGAVYITAVSSSAYHGMVAGEVGFQVHNWNDDIVEACSDAAFLCGDGSSHTAPDCFIFLSPWSALTTADTCPDRYCRIGVVEIEASNRAPLASRQDHRKLFGDPYGTLIGFFISIRFFPTDHSAAAVQWRRDPNDPHNLIVAGQYDFGINALSLQVKASFDAPSQDAASCMPATNPAAWVRYDPCEGAADCHTVQQKREWVKVQLPKALYRANHRPVIAVDGHDLFQHVERLPEGITREELVGRTYPLKLDRVLKNSMGMGVYFYDQ